MSKRDREIINMIQSVGLTKVGDIVGIEGNAAIVTAQARNGVKRNFTFNRDSGDVNSNRRLMSELKRFVADNPPPKALLGPMQLGLMQAAETGQAPKKKIKPQRKVQTHKPAQKVLQDVKELEKEVKASMSVPTPPATTPSAPPPATIPPRLQTAAPTTPVTFTAAVPTPPSPPKPTMPTKKTPAKTAITRSVLDIDKAVALADWIRHEYKWDEIKPTTWAQVLSAAKEALKFDMSIANVQNMADRFNLKLTGRPLDLKQTNAIFAKYLELLCRKTGVPVGEDLMSISSPE